jgi:hypothetical protein
MRTAAQAFNDWMNGGGSWSLTLDLAAALLIFPAITLAHELGHAAIGLARTEGLVVVRVGRAPARVTRRIGRLHLELNVGPGRNEPAGMAAVYARYGVSTNVMLLLAGPIAGAAAGAALVAVAARAHSTMFVVAGIVGAAASLLNLVPFERDGFRSDGLLLSDAIREARRRGGAGPSAEVESFVQMLADAHSRWLALYTDDRSPVRTTARSGLLGGAPRALGYADLTSANALAIWRLAFAGWCWRDVERGDFESTREATLDAVHRATLDGAVGHELTEQAAVALARDAPLGLASPGSGDGGARFLAGAFWKMPAALRPETVSEADLKFAFRYGVALRDVERVRG